MVLKLTFAVNRRLAAHGRVRAHVTVRCPAGRAARRYVRRDAAGHGSLGWPPRPDLPM